MPYEFNTGVSSTPTKFQKKILVKYFTDTHRPSGKDVQAYGGGGGDIAPCLIPNYI